MASVLQNVTKFQSFGFTLLRGIPRTIPWNQKCLYSKGESKFSNSFNSVILLQDGLNIEELPIAIRKANEHFMEQIPKETPMCEDPESVLHSPFDSCRSINEVLTTLDVLNSDQVSATIALHAIRKIAEVGQNFEYRNQGSIESLRLEQDMRKTQSFTLDAVLLQLVNTVCKNGSAQHGINCLKLLSFPSFPGRVISLQKLLAEACISDVLDSSCSIQQVCDIVKLFSHLSKETPYFRHLPDKLWVGLISQTIDENNILSIFEVVPYLKASQRLIFNHAENKLADCIFKLSVADVINILNLIEKSKLPPKKICMLVSNWSSRVFHEMNEDSIRKMLVSFRCMEYCDATLIKVFERFFKLKSGSPIDQPLMMAALDFCDRFRVYSPPIFQSIADSFVETGPELSITAIELTLKTFGHLNYRPSNDFEFWSTVEQVLEDKWMKFRLEPLLDVLLSCIYVERYPMNFTPRLFSTHFIQRLHSQAPAVAEFSRTKMKLFDVAMMFECSQYGPVRVLPKDFQPKSRSQDTRILRMSRRLLPLVKAMVKDGFVVTDSVVLSDLPLHSIYVIDLMISPAKEPVHYRYGYNRPCRGTAAILIHPPSHLTSEKKLTGQQIMRNRHLKLLGFRVINLHLEVLQNYSAQNELFHFVRNQIALQFQDDSPDAT